MKNCKNCANYKAYYERKLFRFWKEKLGYCINGESDVGEKDVCKQFKISDGQPATLEEIDAVIEDIKALEKIYCDKIFYFYEE